MENAPDWVIAAVSVGSILLSIGCFFLLPKQVGRRRRRR
jgi:hypothetical protein